MPLTDRESFQLLNENSLSTETGNFGCNNRENFSSNRESFVRKQGLVRRLLLSLGIQTDRFAFVHARVKRTKDRALALAAVEVPARRLGRASIRNKR